jgi:putative NADH-flavin reductase
MSSSLVPVLARLLGLALCCSSLSTAATELRIAVIGGSGQIGQRVVDEALARGHRVTALARDPARVTRRHDPLEVVAADVLDSEALRTHLAGHDVVISAVGSGRVADADGTLYRAAAASLLAALRALGADAPRLIVVGGVGTLRTADGALVMERVPPERLAEHRGQQAALELLKATHDVRWTYASPPARIAPGERRGHYRLGGDELLVDADGTSAISMEDFAVALLDEAEQARHVGRRFSVAY